MKPTTPVANIIIATLYLFTIIAIGYLSKLVLKKQQELTTNKRPKYSSANMVKGLAHPSIHEGIDPIKVLLLSLATKYSIVGAFFNGNKFYLFKQFFMVAVSCAACCMINGITLWPIALSFLFMVLFFVMAEVFGLPFCLNFTQRIEQQSKNKSVGGASVDQIQIEPSFPIQGLSEPCNEPKVQTNLSAETTHSYRFIGFISVMLFVTLILISQAMFSIYNSVSNLGALNIGSALIVILIDQLAIRPFLAAGVVLSAKVIIHVFQVAFAQKSEAAKQKSKYTNEKMKLFSYRLFRGLCEDALVERMNIAYLEAGEPSELDNGSSSSKKRSSESKASKRGPAESETMIQISKADMRRSKELECIEEEEFRSPIKSIEMPILKYDNVVFTSIEKQMFGGDDENNQRDINKGTTMDGINKIKINPLQFFSIQRLPKQELTHFQEKIEDEDGLVMVEGGFDLIKNKNKDRKALKENGDANQGSAHKKKQNARYQQKRRQLIITGSSPYLEYLPDMMKKEKLLRKSNNTPSQPQINTMSRKIL